MNFWLLQETIIISPLALFVFVLVGIALGWTFYGIRGYRYWYQRFYRYGMRPMHIRRSTGYLEYPTELRMQQAPKKAYPQTQDIPYATKNDLQIIEGIGPKIEKILNDNGIYTWRELAQTPSSNIKIMLENAGKAFVTHDPTTWPKQAQMADTGYWDELKEYQDILFGGRKEKTLE